MTEGAGGALGARRFSFAVIADTHVNQEEGKASSDFAVNRLSNSRNRHVLQEIARARPAFVLHLGDIVHPTPGHPGYATAANAFHALASALGCPLHLTPGNHDVGDKPGDWLPVPSVSDAYLELYRRHFGAHYFSFDSHGCHFVVIDAQIVNSGLACEAAQRAWLEADLAANAGRRMFMCSHYPPYLLDPAENSHYDNIDEPGRSWLLALLRLHKVEALFAGHVHNFWYHRHAGTEIYLLPSTAFVRLDYSELFRIEPAAERGRNDAPKLGYFLVDVHERGHVAHPVRSHGACLASGCRLPQERTLGAVHPKLPTPALLGMDLRQPWAEITQVAASGALDEFSRKAARNDYPLMALWEMGVRHLRVPFSDLSDSSTRERMRDLQQCGHTFTVYTHGVPSAASLDLLLREAPLIAGWEVIAPLQDIGSIAARVVQAKRAASIHVSLSRLRRPGDAQHHGVKARHVIEHGFYLSEKAELAALLARDDCAQAFDGFLFRLSRASPAWAGIAAAAQLADALGRSAQVYLRLAADNPAEACDDDLANANRVAEAMLAAFAGGQVRVWVDTLADVDRGYFPRTGVVDRRYNPRLSGYVIRNLHSALANLARLPDRKDCRTPFGSMLTAGGPGGQCALLLPERKCTTSSIPWAGGRARVELEWIDLASGTIETISAPQAPGSGTLQLSCPVELAAPVLLRAIPPAAPAGRGGPSPT